MFVERNNAKDMRLRLESNKLWKISFTDMRTLRVREKGKFFMCSLRKERDITMH